MCSRTFRSRRSRSRRPRRGRCRAGGVPPAFAFEPFRARRELYRKTQDRLRPFEEIVRVQVQERIYTRISVAFHSFFKYDARDVVEIGSSTRDRQAFESNPAVALLGARQVGKTTIAHRIAEEWDGETAYFDLERPADLARLTEPELALEPLSGLVILDEIQRRPDLFPVLRGLIDRDPNRHFSSLGAPLQNCFVSHRRRWPGASPTTTCRRCELTNSLRPIGWTSTRCGFAGIPAQLPRN